MGNIFWFCKMLRKLSKSSIKKQLPQLGAANGYVLSFNKS